MVLCSAFALVTLSACGTLSGADDAKAVTLTTPTWAGGKANTAVAAYLLEKELGYDVTVRTMDEAKAWQAVGGGKADAILEDWGRESEKKKYVQDEKTVVPAGDLGVEGEVGWYVPDYVADKHPDVTDWKKLDRYAQLFRTAKSGNKGQVLEGSPEFLTHDDAIIKNLGLDYTTVYAGSEDEQVAYIRKMAEQRKPFLTYWWRPHWLDLDVRLKKVELPPHYAGCDDDPEKVRCGYPETQLQKYLSADFSKRGGDAATFLKNFQWSQDDQNKVAKSMAVDGLSAREAAEQWVEDNPGTWKVWLWGLGE